MEDAGTGLMDYKARFYSAYLNRFLQPDSIIPNPADPQSTVAGSSASIIQSLWKNDYRKY